MWANRISTISLIATWQSHNYINSPAFASFLKNRARAWNTSVAPPSTPIARPSRAAPQEAWERETLCPTFSGGEAQFAEMIFPRMQRVIMEWTDVVTKDLNYCNPEFIIRNTTIEDGMAQILDTDA
jgi:hypothetical protein